MLLRHFSLQLTNFVCIRLTCIIEIYQELRVSASRVNGDEAYQWERANFDPLQNRYPLTDRQNLPQVIMLDCWRPIYLCQI